MKNIREPLPSIGSLLAFERFSRLGNVRRTAEELHTSQAAISRHLKRLEYLLGTSLVKPSGRGLILTPAGEAYAVEVANALRLLREAGQRLQDRSRELVIACTHEVSHLILMPRYNALKKTLGRDVHIRIVTSEYETLPIVMGTGVDIVFRYAETRPDRYATHIFKEELMPVAAPAFVRRHRGILDKSPPDWSGLPRIALSKNNSGWATWEDWFNRQGIDPPAATSRLFDNYIYALEAAANGEGIVLAWRWFADEYLASGRLIPLDNGWTSSSASLYGVLTEGATAKPIARKFIARLSAIMCDP